MAATWRRRRQERKRMTSAAALPSAPAPAPAPATSADPTTSPHPPASGDSPAGADTSANSASPLPRLRARSWFVVLWRTVREFRRDELPDRAAALTYYGVLAIFPALLVLVSTLGFVSQSAADTLLTNVQQLAPGAARDILRDAVTGLRDRPGTGGVLALAGLAGALWSASSYIAAFIRAANVVYDIAEGRPVWKVVPLRIAVTVLLAILLAVSVGIVVVSGGVADRAGGILGVDVDSLHAWSYLKWPVLALLVSLMIALLYWSTPNVRGRGFRWLTPGSVLAVVLWLAASAGFASYVANVGSYNRTYGTLAGVIVFLVWLWLSNLAVLLGLEFDAEIARERALLTGLPAHTELYAQPRDTRAWRRPHNRLATTTTTDLTPTAPAAPTRKR